MSSEPQGQPEEIQKEEVNDNAENEKLLKKILEDNEEKEPFSLRSFIQVCVVYLAVKTRLEVGSELRREGLDI